MIFDFVWFCSIILNNQKIKSQTEPILPPLILAVSLKPRFRAYIMEKNRIGLDKNPLSRKKAISRINPIF
jgi:hypothetical protein